MEKIFKNYTISCLILLIYIVMIAIINDIHYTLDLLFIAVYSVTLFIDIKLNKVKLNKVNIAPILLPSLLILFSHFFNFNLDIFVNMLVNFILLLTIMKIRYTEDEYNFINGILIVLLFVDVIVSLYGYSNRIYFETMVFINSNNWLFNIGRILFIIALFFKALFTFTIGYKVNKRCDVYFVVIIAFFILGRIDYTYYNPASIIVIIGSAISYFDSLKTKKILFISSSGGHLDELLQLKPLFDKYDYHLVTEHTNSTLSLRKKHPNKVDYLLYGTRFNMKSYIYKFTFNCFKTIYLFFKIRPTIIITTGAHTAVPMCYFGKFAGTKIIFIESFANLSTKTLSGRLVYPIADKFIVQWESTKKLYPKAVLGGWIY